MDIGSFLADESLGGSSWADEEVDLNSIEAYKSTTAAPIGTGAGTGAVSSGWGASDSGSTGFGGGERRERKEFPIPDQPPYRARVGNLPWDGISEDDVVRYFEDRMQAKDIISDLKLPTDRETGKLKGYAFVSFNERSILEEALNLNLSEFSGRRIFVNVAAPQRSEDGDWKRSGPLGGGRREEPNFDWGSARNSQAALPPRERSFRGGERGDRPERPPRKEEPELDWGVARSSHATLPPRERSFRERGDRGDRPERPKKEEPELDWGVARSSHATLPPRERSFRGERGDRAERPKKDEPELDWGVARSSHTTLPPRERSNRYKKEEPELDWKRGQALQPRAPKAAPAAAAQKEDKKSEQPKPQKSSYSVLAGLEGDDDSEDEEEHQEQENPEVEQLEKDTANLTVADSKEDSDGWEVVGK
ncbi:Eukaryotic translation initiation factor 4B [Spathaspora sp. JA1]|nr:Eukaryotic translation initiation factor 4B [Spathaspora sp. JA1]